ncbi:MAG: helix-hairpin-helix domain-containing protein [Woeseia sp.]
MKNLKYCLSFFVFFGAGPVFAGPVDVNSADAATLAAELQGVGMAKAAAIVEHRETYGPFSTADDLILVKGIGERTVEINRNNILLQPQPAD